MNLKTYKWCVVPQCVNTTVKTPEKLFIHVPNQKNMRKIWLQLARRDPTHLSTIAPLYFCEDHFDLPSDMDNYMQYKVMGSVGNIRMKPGCLPSKFECHSDRRKRTSTSTVRPGAIKRQRKTLVDDAQLTSKLINTSTILAVSMDEFPKPVSDSITQEFIVPKIEQFENVMEEMEYKCSVEAERKDFSNHGSEANFCNVVDEETFKVNDTALTFSKMIAGQSEVGMKTEETECFVDQFVDPERKIWDRKDFLSTFDCVKQEDDEDNTLHSLVGSKCHLPNDEIMSKGDLKQKKHIDGVHVGIKSHECHICQYNAGGKADLKRHIDDVHSSIKKHKCHICGYSTHHKATLKRHIDYVHMGIKSHKCHICEYSASRETGLKRHIDCVHLGIKNHICHICKYSTYQKVGLKKHMDSVHMGIKSHTCHICEYCACGKNEIKRHINSVHLGIRNHKCHICEFSSSEKAGLTRHIDSVHLCIKNHKCHICKFNTYLKTDLQRHIDGVHMGIKSHRCHICEYSARDSSGLKRHIDGVHSGIKNHKCHICEYSTGIKQSLKKHIDSVHLGIKNHKCDTCGYSTYSTDALKKHIDSIHMGIKSHSCHICEYRASRKASLKRHINSIHLGIKNHK